MPTDGRRPGHRRHPLPGHCRCSWCADRGTRPVGNPTIAVAGTGVGRQLTAVPRPATGIPTAPPRLGARRCSLEECARRQPPDIRRQSRTPLACAPSRCPRLIRLRAPLTRSAASSDSARIVELVHLGAAARGRPGTPAGCRCGTSGRDLRSRPVRRTASPPLCSAVFDGRR